MGRLAAVVATAGAAAVAVALYRKYFRSAAGRLRIRDLYVYPIKGCRGIRVASWPVSRVGLFGDRMLMLVDTDGRFVSLRNEPGLVRIRPDLPYPDAATLRVSFVGKPDSWDVPLAGGGPGAGARRTVDVWGNAAEGEDCGDATASWFSAKLGRSVRVLRCASNQPHAQRVDEDYNVTGDGATLFSDGFPILVASQASLVAITAAVAKSSVDVEVPMERFRPNIVLEGSRAFEEETWTRAQIGDCELMLPKPCARCTVPNVHPETGVCDREVGRALSETHSGTHAARQRGPYSDWFASKKKAKDTFFGMNALVRGDERHLLSVGMAVSAS